MADDFSKRGGQDRSRIAMHEEHEVRYWTHATGVTKEQLAEAVQKVGNSADGCGNTLQGAVMPDEQPTRPGPVEEPPAGPDKPGEHSPVREPVVPPPGRGTTGLTTEHIRYLSLLAQSPSAEVPSHIAYDLRSFGLARGSFICMRITDRGWRYLRLSTTHQRANSRRQA